MQFKLTLEGWCNRCQALSVQILCEEVKPIMCDCMCRCVYVCVTVYV